MTVRLEGITGTTEPFLLAPGSYIVTFTATTWGSGVTLQRLLTNGTWADTPGPKWTIDTADVRDFAGEYRLVVGTATGVNAWFITRQLY